VQLYDNVYDLRNPQGGERISDTKEKLHLLMRSFVFPVRSYCCCGGLEGCAGVGRLEFGLLPKEDD
jgi:hypothetical protein